MVEVYWSEASPALPSRAGGVHRSEVGVVLATSVILAPAAPFHQCQLHGMDACPKIVTNPRCRGKVASTLIDKQARHGRGVGP